MLTFERRCCQCRWSGVFDRSQTHIIQILVGVFQEWIGWKFCFDVFMQIYIWPRCMSNSGAVLPSLHCVLKQWIAIRQAGASLPVRSILPPARIGRWMPEVVCFRTLNRLVPHRSSYLRCDIWGTRTHNIYWAHHPLRRQPEVRGLEQLAISTINYFKLNYLWLQLKIPQDLKTHYTYVIAVARSLLYSHSG